MSDAGEMPLERLETEITSWAGNIAAATAQLLGWIAEYDQRQGWAQWGARSCAEWMSWKCGDSLHTAREKVRVARALADLPEAAAAFAGGELSYSKVRAITRVTCAVDDAAWVEQARHATGAELDRLVAAVARSLDESDTRSAFERRRCLKASVIASRMIDEAVNGSGRKRHEVIQDRGGMAAIRADALLEMAERTLARSPAAAERGDVGRLQLVADTETLSAIADEPADGVCTLGGERVDREVARRCACDIRASVVVDHEGHGCDEGRETRVLNRRLRRALHRRDHGSCRFPGCGVTSWLHAHHIIHWTDGGLTDLANLVSLCGLHHTMVHEGGWSVAIVDRAVVWSDADGVPDTIEQLDGDDAAVSAAGISPQALEARWHRDHLDFAFAVAVITEHCLRARVRAGDVPAGTSLE